jgi:hypothetical protein
VTEPFDTSPAAAEVQRAVLREMTGSERMALGLQMSDDARQLALDGLRHRHPEFSEAESQRALRRLMLGDELADVVEHAR